MTSIKTSIFLLALVASLFALALSSKGNKDYFRQKNRELKKKIGEPTKFANAFGATLFARCGSGFDLRTFANLLADPNSAPFQCASLESMLLYGLLPVLNVKEQNVVEAKESCKIFNENIGQFIDEADQIDIASARVYNFRVLARNACSVLLAIDNDSIAKLTR